MVAQSGHRTPTGDCTMHCGQIRSSQRPQRRLEATSGSRRQNVSNVSLVIGETGYPQIVNIYRNKLDIGYRLIQSSLLAMSRSKTRRVHNSRPLMTPALSRSELDVIRLAAVTNANATENQTNSIGRFKRTAQTGIRITAIKNQTAESFQGVNSTPSAGTDP